MGFDRKVAANISRQNRNARMLASCFCRLAGVDAYSLDTIPDIYLEMADRAINDPLARLGLMDILNLIEGK